MDKNLYFFIHLCRFRKVIFVCKSMSGAREGRTKQCLDRGKPRKQYNLSCEELEKMKRRILSVLLSLVMVFSLLPTAALAEETPPANETVVAMIGKTPYTDLHNALEAAGENDTVVLQSDVTLTGDWTPIANFVGTLDGNNKTIYGLSVTSTNSTIDVSNETTSGAGLFAYLRGAVHDLTIDGAVINVPNAAQNVGVLAGRAEYKAFTNVKITNATITSNAQYVGGLIGFGYGNVTGCEVSNSTITGKDQVGGLFGYHKLINVQNNTLTNNDVTATEERAGGIFGKLQVVLGDLGTGTATLSGCTVSGGSATAPDYAGGIAGQLMGAGDDDTDKYSITGNKVENFALKAEKEKSSFATIRDGNYKTFLGALNTEVTGNTLEDISGTLDETWKVKETYKNFTVYERCVAQIGGEKYTTLNAAITAAQDGDTVNIIADCNISPIEIKGNITIEGNGHTVTGWDTTDVSGSAIDIENKKVTFRDIKFTDFACGDAYTDSWAAVIVGYNGCDITVTNCSFKNFNRQAIDFSPRNSVGNLTVTGCTFDCTPVKDTFTIQKAIIISPKTNASSSKVAIKDCEISNADAYNITEWSAGGIEINGGEVSVENCTMTNCEVGILASREYWGASDYDANIDITLKDTSISAWNVAVWLECYKSDDTNTTAAIAIESGYYKGAVGIGENNEPTDDDLKKCSISLTGGYYSVEPDAEYVHADYYVDASNISGYPYVVRQGTKPSDTIVILKDETTPSISAEVTDLTENDKTAIKENTKVEGVTEAVAGSKDTLVENSKINAQAEGVDKINVDVDVKVELTAADLSAENKTMTYTATPVATVTTTKTDGTTIDEKTDIEVPNSLLNGYMTVRLPLPGGFEPEQIKHSSSDGSVEYFLKTSARGAKTFTTEDGCAVFTITKFSTFELSSTKTYVEPSNGNRTGTVAKPSVNDAAEDAAADGSGWPFTDVPADSWYYSSVEYVHENGLMTGTSRTTFSPNADTTRGMIVTILARLEGESTSGTPWYAAGQNWAMANGVSDGTGMERCITREQLAAMLYRYAKLCGYDVTADVASIQTFADYDTASAYAREAMAWCVENGLIQGSNGRLAPQESASRAQVATILTRFAQKIVK